VAREVFGKAPTVHGKDVVQLDVIATLLRLREKRGRVPHRAEGGCQNLHSLGPAQERHAFGVAAAFALNDNDEDAVGEGHQRF